MTEKDVAHPERHWWIVSHSYFENLEPGLRSHADIFDFLLTLNLSTSAPVFFSQTPGQVVGGAYRVTDDALDYRDDLSPGKFPLTLLSSNEIPERVELTVSIPTVYPMVRKFRSMKIESDEDMDIRVALHVYDDALTTTLWTSIANYYYVCENLLLSGRPTGKERDQRIEALTRLSVSEASGWRKMVNRIKHPDKGNEITGLLEADDVEMPPINEMRVAASKVPPHTMAQRYEELGIDQ
jgi:hypothetical protein